MKTPKEKAEELVDKYISDGLLDRYMGITSAKQCALIAVDEIIYAIKHTDAKSDFGYVGYWNSVKTEIQNL